MNKITITELRGLGRGCSLVARMTPDEAASLRAGCARMKAREGRAYAVRESQNTPGLYVVTALPMPYQQVRTGNAKPEEGGGQ